MKIGLIGGYGLQKILEEKETETYRAEFEDEKVNGKLPEYVLIKGNIGDKEVIVIPRHGKEHDYPPHSIPFKSYFKKFEEEGVEKIITTNSAGVMIEDCEIPSFFLIEDFVNEGREITYYDEFPKDPVHINLSNPYDKELKGEILESCRELGYNIVTDAVYVNSQGPRLETRAEIKNKYSKLGDIIGMTGAKEAILANEKKIPIASIGMGTNTAEGIGGKATFEEIKENAERMQERVHKLIRKTIENLR